MAPNLQGKKKKKKAKKKINPNAYMDNENLDVPSNPYDSIRKSSLAAAGASIGHMSSYDGSKGAPGGVTLQQQP